MATITFDTLAFVKRLKNAGIDETQAEIQVQAINQALSDFQSTRLSELATRADLEGATSLLKAELQAEIASSKTEIIKWVAGMLVIQAGVVPTLVKLL